jgi:hypothetical protein
VVVVDTAHGHSKGRARDGRRARRLFPDSRWSAATSPPRRRKH